MDNKYLNKKYFGTQRHETARKQAELENFMAELLSGDRAPLADIDSGGEFIQPHGTGELPASGFNRMLDPDIFLGRLNRAKSAFAIPRRRQAVVPEKQNILSAILSLLSRRGE